MDIYDYYPELINLNNMTYPTDFYSVKKANPNVSFGYPVKEISLVNFGYAPVYEVDKPNVEMVVTKGFPELREDGNWYQTWDTRPYTQEEYQERISYLRQILKDNATSVLELDKESGVLYEINGSNHLISLKDNELTNLLIVKRHAGTLPTTDEVSYFFADNSFVKFTSEEMDTMAQFAIKSSFDLLQNYYEFLASVYATTVIEELPTLPSTFKE